MDAVACHPTPPTGGSSVVNRFGFLGKGVTPETPHLPHDLPLTFVQEDVHFPVRIARFAGRSTEGDTMVHIMPISRTRDKLTTFPSTLKTSDTIAVTSRGKRVLAVMSWQKYDVIRETMSILGDPALMRSLKRSLREARTGSLVSLAKVAKDLG
jgi:PHD/YefM family antitoxin component YafN of YafNO toxin-antitoxin module